MRLPIDKPYRAFPEFDRFDDEQCRRFQRLARKRGGLRTAGFLLLSTFAWMLGLFVIFPLLAWQSVVQIQEHPNDSLWMFAAILGSFGFPTLMILFGFYTRDRWLREALSRLIADVTCEHCGYSLLGLPAPGDCVRCPECASVTDLRTLGLTPQQIAGAPDPAGDPP